MGREGALLDASGGERTCAPTPPAVEGERTLTAVAPLSLPVPPLLLSLPAEEGDGKPRAGEDVWVAGVASSAKTNSLEKGAVRSTRRKMLRFRASVHETRRLKSSCDGCD